MKNIRNYYGNVMDQNKKSVEHIVLLIAITINLKGNK